MTICGASGGRPNLGRMKRRPKQPLPDEPPTPSDAGAASIVQIRIWLVGIGPKVWRRVLVPTKFTLRELHGVIWV